MLKILFIGTAEFAVVPLGKLIGEHQLVGVVTQPDRPSGRRQELTASPVKRFLAENGHTEIPLFQPEKLRTEAEAILTQTQPDLIVVVAYGQILPKALVEGPRLGAINVHGSLLPKYRGAIPIEKALLNGDEITGVSILQMTPELDDGPVWLEHEEQIQPEDDAVSLRERLSTKGAELLLEAIELIETGQTQPTPQTELAKKHGREVSYCKAEELHREQGEIKPEDSAVTAWSKVRAFANAGGAWIKIMYKLTEQELKVWRARILSTDPQIHNWGKVKREGKQLTLSLGGGKLELLELQLAGKKRDSASNYFFLNEEQDAAARVVVKAGNELLIMRREKHGRSYIIFPGGHLRIGEEPQLAAARELIEETGITSPAAEFKFLLKHVDADYDNFISWIYLLELDSKPEVEMQGEELLRNSEANKYELAWLAIDAEEWHLLKPPGIWEEIRKSV